MFKFNFFVLFLHSKHLFSNNLKEKSVWRIMN